MAVDVAAQIETWRTQLLDTSKRNRLINFKTGRGGGIALVHPDPAELWHALVAEDAALAFPWKGDLIDLPMEPEETDPDSAGSLTPLDPGHTADSTCETAHGQGILERCRCSPRLRPDHLLTELPDKQLAARLRRLDLTAGEALTEQGISVLYVAFGFLRWYESAESQVEICSPLLLLPVRLERDSVEAPWRIQAEDEEILPNHTLAQLLDSNFKLHLPALDGAEGDPDDPAWRTGYFAAVQQCVRHHPRWEVLDEAALGTFNFQKLAMWEDLGRNREQIQNHDLCRAIAGDTSVAFRIPANVPAPEELDEQVPPHQAHLILDADSSQHAAVVTALRGASLVLDGPPGTGKSQTIANLIAESLAAGRTVLFVSEKAAALDVVKRRLDDRGLGDFCLELHSHKANKRAVIEELGRCLNLVPDSPHDHGEDLDQLFQARRQLNEYVRELHQVRSPLGLSAFQVHGELARLARLASTSRCPISQVLHRDAAYLRRLTELLTRLPDCHRVIELGDNHPWRGCRAAVYSLTLRDDVRHHLGRLAACVRQAAEAAPLLAEVGLEVADLTCPGWLAALTQARSILACPLVPAAWFARDARRSAEAVIQLDRVTRKYRQVRNGLPEFAPEALRDADPGALAAPRGDCARLLPRPDDTLRARCRRLARAGEALRELLRRTTASDQALQRVITLLQVPLPPLAVRGLRRFADLAEHAARMQPVRRSWWDPARRQELQNAATRAQEEARLAQEQRAELVTRLSPQAFAAESAPVAYGAGRFRSFLMRLLPGWWRLKAQAAAWYTQGLPATAALVDDLDRLATYHRRLDYCCQVRGQYAADLLPAGEGDPDWASTLEGLRSVDQLEQLAKIPAALQAVLSGEGTLDRTALAAASADLARQVTSLHEQFDVVAGEYDLGEVTAGASRHVRLPACDFARWLEAQIAAVDRERTLLEKIRALLIEDHDLAMSAVPALLQALAELAELQAQAGRLCEQIWGANPPRAVEDRDWSALRERAEGLLRFLDGWGRSVPPPVVRALTVPEARAQLEEAVCRNDAVCSQGFDVSWQFLAGLFDLGQEVSTGVVIDRTPLAELHGWLAARADDPHRIHEWTQFCEIRREVEQAGVLPILTEVLAGQVQLAEAADAFRARFLRLWLDALYEQAPALRQFSTDGHERLTDKFRALDRRSVESASARVRATLLSRPDRPRAISAEAPGSSELGTLLREVNKRRRHLPLRRLFAAVPTLLPRLKPCLMMSPLAVSTYLQTPDFRFDLVIFDEASQVRPHDAICAIYRGRQLLVAGDQKQLPPTSFFERSLDADGRLSDEDEDDGTGLSNFESVLDVCCTLGLARRRLRWHYRSRREPLIAFSNHHFYSNELVTFPSVHDTGSNPAVAFEYVTEGRWKAGSSGGYNAVESARTAERVLGHFREHPEQSLGVIAFSQRQQLRILDELERLRRASPELEEFFREDRREPFFVKNLENVQGDERDVIFLSVGYGPDETGRVAMRFGPLNRAGGQRRLNVAVTRARRGMRVVSSLRAQDIDLSRTAAVGVRLLRAYLDFAERGPEALHGAITEDSARDFDSPFEREVFDELTRRGLAVHPQVGCSGFRIDLAVVDPRAPGRYLLGVECDGRTYHSSATARDRDRLRQEVLESLGWRICRIWSTDWVRDRDSQVRRVLAALEKAQRGEPASAPILKPVPSKSPAPPAPAGRSEGPISEVAALNYKSIDEVPEGALRDVILETLRSYGATAAGDLAQTVARRLGFKRTGKRIQARIEDTVEDLVRAGQVGRASDQRLQQAQPT